MNILSPTENRAQQDATYNVLKRDEHGCLCRDLRSNRAVRDGLWTPGSVAEWTDHGKIKLGAAREISAKHELKLAHRERVVVSVI